MIFEGYLHVPEVIDCSEIVHQLGGRVKGGQVNGCELLENEEIRVSIRSSRYPSVEIFTIRNLKPCDYQIVLVAIPKNNGKAKEA